MKITNSQKIGLFVIIVLVALFFALNFLKGHDLAHVRSTVLGTGGVGVRNVLGYDIHPETLCGQTGSVYVK